MSGTQTENVLNITCPNCGCCIKYVNVEVEHPKIAPEYASKEKIEDKQSDDDDSDDDDDESDDDELNGSIDDEPETTSRQPSVYQKFMTTTIRRLRELHPELSNYQLLSLAIPEWNEYKKLNGIVTGRIELHQLL